MRVHSAVVLIRRNGTIARTWSGAAAEADLRPIIDALIAP